MRAATRLSKPLIAPVTSFNHLSRLCNEGNKDYQKLVICAVENLGHHPVRHSPNESVWKTYYNGLIEYIGALECEYQDADAEQSILDEVNFVRECIDQITDAQLEGKK